MKPVPFFTICCQDLLLEAIWTNQKESFDQIVGQVLKQSLTVDTIKIGEKIAESSLLNKPQWFETLRTIKKYPFPHGMLRTAAATAQKNNDIPTLLFVFNELHDNHNFQRKSVLLEIFPIYHYVRQVLSSPITPEIEQTLPKMLEVCSQNQCRCLVLNCLKDENFTHIDAFASQIDLEQLAEYVQTHYKNGDTKFESAVSYFQNRTLCLAVQDTQSFSLSSKRKI